MAIDSDNAILSEHDDAINIINLGEPLINTTNGRQDENKDTIGGTSFVGTCFNGLNALSGVGILSIPYALSEGGWVSLLLLVMVAIMSFYTSLLLKRCMNVHPRIKSYPDIGELAFGYKGRLTVSAFMCLELYLTAVGFLILAGDNLDKLFPDSSLKIGTWIISGKQYFIVLVTLVILPTTWLRNLGVLAYVSAGGVLASLIVVASVSWASTVDGAGFHKSGRLMNLRGLPTALGLYTFCYCGHGVFPTLYSSMKDNMKFSKVLLLCFILCTVNYGTIGIIGYLMYGEDVKSQVTLNLPLGKLSTRLAICTTLISPLTKYALLVTPVATAIEGRLLFHCKISTSILIRTLLVFGTVFIALVIPFFSYLTALIGSFLGIFVSMFLPCICYLKIFKPSRVHRVELVIIIGILLVGFLIASLGTCSSLQKIVHEL